MNGARIRHMNEGDAAAVAALAATSWRNTYTPLIGAERVESALVEKYGPDRIADDLELPHSESLVAEASGGIVGYAYAFVTEGALWLDRLHVAPDWQGKGVACDLLHAVLADFVGERAISLEVIEGNQRAIRFYEREGFVATERREVCGGIDGVPTLVMRKALPRA